MNTNTWLLCLLVVAAYLNLFLTFKRVRKSQSRQKLPMDYKECNNSYNDGRFKSGLSNRKRLRERKNK